MALIVLGGVGLTFGMWWIYFLLPAGEVLHHRRDRSFVWGYGHFFVYAVDRRRRRRPARRRAVPRTRTRTIGATAVMLSIAIPVAVYFVVAGAPVRQPRSAASVRTPRG